MENLFQVAGVIELLKAFGSMAFALVVLYGFYRIVTRFGNRLLEIQTSQLAANLRQAEAMDTLAKNVKSTFADQEEILIVLRTLSRKSDEMGEQLESQSGESRSLAAALARQADDVRSLRGDLAEIRNGIEERVSR